MKVWDVYRTRVEVGNVKWPGKTKEGVGEEEGRKERVKVVEGRGVGVV